MPSQRKDFPVKDAKQYHKRDLSKLMMVVKQALRQTSEEIRRSAWGDISEYLDMDIGPRRTSLDRVTKELILRYVELRLNHCCKYAYRTGLKYVGDFLDQNPVAFRENVEQALDRAFKRFKKEKGKDPMKHWESFENELAQYFPRQPIREAKRRYKKLHPSKDDKLFRQVRQLLDRRINGVEEIAGELGTRAPEIERVMNSRRGYQVEIDAKTGKKIIRMGSRKYKETDLTADLHSSNRKLDEEDLE